MQPAEPQPHDAHAALLRMLTHALRQRAERRKELERLQKAADEYEELQQMLRALPAKVEHQMLVPFGKLAFFPGTLKHTNEIMVLLGDNYFALRSAEQAAAIAGRRAEFVRPKVAAAEAEVATLDARIRQIRQYGELQMRDNPEGTIEIREPYFAFTQQVTERDPTAPPSEADISMSEVHCEAVRLQQIRASRSGTVVYDPLERDASARGDGDDGSAADNKPVSRFKASRMRQQQQQ